jgi:hypothetical protein
MSELQFTNQENQVNFANDGLRSQSRVAKNRPQLKFIPIALGCAVVFVGAVIFSKIQTEKMISENDLTLDLNAPNITGGLVRENAISPLDQATDEATLSATQNRLRSLTSPTPKANGPVVVTPTPISVAAPNKPVATPIPTPKVVATSVTTPKPVVTLPTTTSETKNTTETRTVVQDDDTYKPGTPYLESCGDFSDEKWHNLKIGLPKFEKDGKAAVEYWVQVGKSVGSNETYDHRFQQTDRVVFAGEYDNRQEYFVRFAIRMEGGDWQKWSNTLRFKCERYTK